MSSDVEGTEAVGRRHLAGTRTRTRVRARARVRGERGERERKREIGRAIAVAVLPQVEGQQAKVEARRGADDKSKMVAGWRYQRVVQGTGSSIFGD